jgi:DNA-binding MarR family transcriptional regulator
MMRTADRLSSPVGLTASRWLLLAGIACGGGARSGRDLAESALLSVQATRRMLAAMESEGLIARSPGRGRSLSIRLTPRGRRVFDKTGALAERFEKSFFRGLPRGRIEDLRRDCARLTTNLRSLETELCKECR